MDTENGIPETEAAVVPAGIPDAAEEKREKEETLIQSVVRPTDVYDPDAETEPMPLREFLEFDFIVRGSGICRILDQAMPCCAGEVFIVPPHIPYGFFLAAEGDGLTVRRISFDVGEWFSGDTALADSARYCYGVFEDGTTAAYARLTQKTRGDVTAIFDSIAEEIAGRRTEWREAVRAQLSLLFITVARYVGNTIRNIPAMPQKERGIIVSAIRLTEARFSESDLTLETIANTLYVSQSYLSRLFTRYAEQPFSDFLRTYRIERACRLLREGDETVEKIVGLCGLRDVPSFYRAFSRALGLTPNQYRNQMRKQKNTKKETGETTMSILNEISENLQIGKAKIVKEQVQQALDAGIPAQQILEEGLLAGMNIIGEKFKNNEVYIPEVLVAARALNMGTQVLKPYFSAEEMAPIGRVCIGTVQGDLHDIGKNLVKMMMEGKQLEVVDLGTDVSAETFVNTAIEQNCQIICCSALLTTTMEVMKEVVDKAVEKGIRDKVKIMIGGAPVNEDYCRKIGADVYTVDAASAADAAVELCNMMAEKN